jgi:hypothetical protein
MAASLVGCDAQGIAPASLLALQQTPRRADEPDWSKSALLRRLQAFAEYCAAAAAKPLLLAVFGGGAAPCRPCRNR